MPRITESKTQALWNELRTARKPRTGPELAESAGVSPSMARRHLRLWSEAGLIIREMQPYLGGNNREIGAYLPGPAMTERAPVTRHHDNGGGVIAPAMDGTEFDNIRTSLHLSMSAFGRALGMTGSPVTVNRAVRRMIDGLSDIRLETADRARALMREAVSDDSTLKSE